MGFDKNYSDSLNSKNLQDDEWHHATDPLFASAIADKTGDGAAMGSLLSRVKNGNGVPQREFESGTQNLAKLLDAWTARVTAKGQGRAWIKVRDEWDLTAVHAMYKRVAHLSLAHWLGGRCLKCHGAGQTATRRVCVYCKGSGKVDIFAGRFERDRSLEMFAELDGLVLAHNDRANRLMSKKK